MNNKRPQINIFWFRRDLRMNDNTGLFHALQSEVPVLPLFIFDTTILDLLEDKFDKRVDMISQMLQSLRLTSIQYGSTLVVKHGKPVDIFKELSNEFDIRAVYTNRDYEPSAIKRDKDVRELLSSKSISFFDFKDQVVFEYDEILKPDKTPYTVFTPYSKAWKNRLSDLSLTLFPSELFLHKLYKTESLAIPEPEEIGFRKTGINYSCPTIDIRILQDYEHTRDFPALENGTSGLSVHLRFGTVSVRNLVRVARETSEIFLNELIWREFFMSILAHFPYVTQGAFKKNYDTIRWRNNEEEFTRWREGRTGFPIVDAGMRQLNETGMMHNRVRMITASFLVKDLLVDWRWGEACFAQKLLDYDLSANNGNWQWAAGCGCDAAPYFRIFNPAEQTKKFDPELRYIQRWVKNLNSPDYPAPVVDHSWARKRTLDTFKAALKIE
jgi:deoxyribodipyrimidine photo-lyase